MCAESILEVENKRIIEVIEKQLMLLLLLVNEVSEKSGIENGHALSEAFHYLACRARDLKDVDEQILLYEEIARSHNSLTSKPGVEKGVKQENIATR